MLPTIGPKIQPTPLQDCARLMRVAAEVLAPSTVVYGLAIVSRNVSPVAMMQTPARKATNAVVADTVPACTMALICVAWMNQNPPAATISSPVMMPPLYPSLLASHPAGIDIRK